MLRKALHLRDDPLTLFRKLCGLGSRAFLFQSAEGPRMLAEYSMLGFAPASGLTLHQGRWATEGDARVDEARSIGDNLRGALPRVPPRDEGYRFLGGLVGSFGYEYVSHLEKLPAHRSEWPELDLGLYLDGIVFDHVRGQTFYFSHGADRSAQVEQAAQQRLDEPAPARGVDLRRVPDEAAFCKQVERAKHHIQLGDIFQVVLSKQVQGRLDGDPLALYEGLLRTNPSPYMYCIQSGERMLVGSSPEMLVRVHRGKVETFPIAGTRPLGDTPEDTERLEHELQADAKEQAEHAMLVDLARNDVGRVARYGSVRVSERQRILRYSHVQHMVSKVEAELAPGKDALDAFHALFPAGTVSGAPKVRAMELIHDIEGRARGAYAGAVGYVGLNGSLDAAITIRTAQVVRDRITVQAGAGIVADSVPASEWREAEHKAQALLRLLGVGA
ncbi:MAG: anthranilate synthase component I family protein [Halobacteriales archaeon]|nr:anthranilate synthase component I family protein [Halobacteriales archaeon]